MSPTGDQPQLAILAARIRSELVEVGAVVARSQYLLNKAMQTQDDDYFDGIALNLHRFYTGVERILEDIAREVDGTVPTGKSWHRDLLMQLSVEVPSIRPTVLQRSSRNCLDEYRGIRHVIRNIYAFNLKPARLKELVVDLPACYTALVQDLNHFCDFLVTVELENL